MNDTKKFYQSRTFWIAVIGTVLGAIQPISTAIGKPIVIPMWVYEVLGALGLYTLRAGNKSIE